MTEMGTGGSINTPPKVLLADQADHRMNVHLGPRLNRKAALGRLLLSRLGQHNGGQYSHARQSVPRPWSWQLYCPLGTN